MIFFAFGWHQCAEPPSLSSCQVLVESKHNWDVEEEDLGSEASWLTFVLLFYLFLGFTSFEVSRTLGHGLLVRNKHVVRSGKGTSDPNPLGPTFVFLDLQFLRYLKLSTKICWYEISKL